MNSFPQKTKPIAVLISDIHFNLNTLEIASKALKAAITKAEDLNTPLIIAGDLQDTKAIIRGEVANRLIELIKNAKCKVYILVGNHDLINEKGSANALEYLRPYAEIVDEPTVFYDMCFIPYQSNAEMLKSILNEMPKLPLIMHQGFLGAAMGDYIQDKSSISPEVVKDFAVISGHYHRHQAIGTVTYIGSPYTITFGEANDGPKGFLILNSDGSFTREILNLRKHVIKEFSSLYELDAHIGPFGELFCNEDDLLWLKVRGPSSELRKLDKASLANFLLCGANFKLDLIPDDASNVVTMMSDKTSKSMTDIEVLDSLIDDEAETDQQKTSLKTLYKEIL